MRRRLEEPLEAWIRSDTKPPLVLRGARQVGKTWLVRELAEISGRTLREVNFERDPRLARAFAAGGARPILEDLALDLGQEIDVARSLLFLDEIQATPEVLASLRWFREELPELPVVAAGSLLEFALGDASFSLPVGRVQYRYLEPMSFDEYLLAHGQDALLERLKDWQPGSAISPAAHDKATAWHERYAMVGGMPAVVDADVSRGDPAECRGLQADLMATYRDDFAKYAKRTDPKILDAVLLAVARQVGQKFVYARVEDGVKQLQARRALELLAKARLVTLAPHSASNGLPLGGEASERHRKALLLDVGLLHALLRTPAGSSFPRREDLSPIVRGQIAEQLAGQQLRALTLGADTVLHYWQRFGGRPGEIDFVVQIGMRVVPVELKAGAAGAMKSLHLFMREKGLDVALRIDTNPPSLQDVDVMTTLGDPVKYQLLNLPGYMVFRAGELVDGVS